MFQKKKLESVLGMKANALVVFQSPISVKDW